MERVLREPGRDSLEALFAAAFDLASGLVFFPVRHHSPACALHLQTVINQYRPDLLLIEGPSDAGRLISALTEETTMPPVCLYASYDDRDGVVSPEKEKYRAYYPFLAYSPELVALKEAKRFGCKAAFIDLPFAAQLVNGGKKVPRQQYKDGNAVYEANRYTALLAKKAFCRNFAEFWESRFEMAAKQPVEKFVRNVIALGYFMRQAQAAADEDVLREGYMAREIRAYTENYKRILVVAGAYHVDGLLQELKGASSQRLISYCKEAAAMYLMPYTFHEADNRNGYSAGMPFPAFYQMVWEKFQKKRKAPFQEAVLEHIVQTARYARKRQPVSLPDEINAYQSVQALATLRKKVMPGVYELLDGVRSAFVKGDFQNLENLEFAHLLRCMSGMRAGKVSALSCVPPVLQEFHALCVKYRLKIASIKRREIVLDLVKNPTHREKSCFFHQLLFLETGFAALKAGPDYVSGKNRNLAREIWVLQYNSQVEARLIDLSVYGATLAELCSAQLEKKFRDGMDAKLLGKVLLSAQVMGMKEYIYMYSMQIAAVLEAETSFENICALLTDLRSLVNLKRAAGEASGFYLNKLLGTVFRKAVEQMAAARLAGEKEETNVCERLRDLYVCSVEQPEICDGLLLLAQAKAAQEDEAANSRFYGVCLAICYQQGAIPEEVFCARMKAYLQSVMVYPIQASSFLCGVFLLTREVLFTDPAVLMELDRMIASLDVEEFLTVLPNLRYAFTQFLPMELNRIGDLIARRHQADGAAVRNGAGLTKEVMQLAMRLDGFAAAQLQKWGIE